MKSVIIIVDSSGPETQLLIEKKSKKLKTPCILLFSKNRLTKGRGIFKGFRIAKKINARAIAMIDSDLKSIEPVWIREFISPIFEKEMDFVGPKYIRDKYDSLITNHLIYPLVNTFLHADLRQPIGGDFAFSKKLVNFYLSKKNYQKEVKKYGIDIWLSFSAIVNNFSVGQVYLGTKDHGITVKNPLRPEKSLGNMFIEVIKTLYDLFAEYQSEWTKNTERKVATLNDFVDKTPKPVAADFSNLWNAFHRLYPKYQKYYRQILPREIIIKIETLYKLGSENTEFDLNLWAELLEIYLEQYAITKAKNNLYLHYYHYTSPE